MAVKRPVLSEDSFLAHLFSPKRAAMPTGIRKSKLAFTPGRKKGRLAAFNRMSPFNQELLKRSGKREAYLRGEGTLGEAKSSLREKAIGKGLAKPIRPRTVSRETSTGPSETLKRNIAARHIITALNDAGYEVASQRVFNRAEFLPSDRLDEIPRYSVGRIRYEAGLQANVLDVEMQYGIVAQVNPFWYK